MVTLSSTERIAQKIGTSLDTDVEAALDPIEAEGIFRDSRKAAALLLFHGALLLSPPTPRPKKG